MEFSSALRFSYLDLQEVLKNPDVLPKINVKDFKEKQIYVNQLILPSSNIGRKSFLVGCILDEGVQVGENCSLIQCKVGNNVNIRDNVRIGESSLLGNNVRIGHYADIGANCEFGDGSEIDAWSVVGSKCKFGDGSSILHWCRLYDPRFGTDTRIGSGNTLYGDPKFANMPKLQESKDDPCYKVRHAYTSLEPGNRLKREFGNEIVFLRDYLNSSSDWKEDWRIKK